MYFFDFIYWSNLIRLLREDLEYMHLQGFALNLSILNTSILFAADGSEENEGVIVQHRKSPVPKQRQQQNLRQKYGGK